MLNIELTPNLTGVTISGDIEDLQQLVDAFHFIVADENEKDYAYYESMCIRVLGVCYDVRHASMGDREALLIENGMNRDLMKFHKLVSSENNVYYRCRVLLPEMMFVVLVLNQLAVRRAIIVSKQKMGSISLRHPLALWDEEISVIRLFQAQFAKAIRGVLSEQSYARWLKMMNDDIVSVSGMARQFLDVLNFDWLEWSREKRTKQLVKLADRLTHYRADADYKAILQVINEGARSFGVHPSDVELEGFDYPDEEQIEW
jgi:hypothetical protein